MTGYLGEVKLGPEDDHPFRGWGRVKWALWFVDTYGCIDGDHHKQWVLDQAARILTGAPVDVFLASWEGGYTEYRVRTGPPGPEYAAWRYGDWDEGVAP